MLNLWHYRRRIVYSRWFSVFVKIQSIFACIDGWIDRSDRWFSFIHTLAGWISLKNSNSMSLLCVFGNLNEFKEILKFFVFVIFSFFVWVNLFPALVIHHPRLKCSLKLLGCLTSDFSQGVYNIRWAVFVPFICMLVVRRQVDRHKSVNSSYVPLAEQSFGNFTTTGSYSEWSHR